VRNAPPASEGRGIYGQPRQWRLTREGDWESAERAFDGDGYLNRLGVHARADRLADLTAALSSRGLPVREWYGVRVFNDIIASDAPVPAAGTLDAILRCEERAGRTDPYRRVAALLHVIAAV
jgi:S-adenosylmethionine-dependent methyltransferase